ncbi:MAG: hypothetical protein ACM3KR_11030 [Deltaproteobacteria bacterium]
MFKTHLENPDPENLIVVKAAELIDCSVQEYLKKGHSHNNNWHIFVPNTRLPDFSSLEVEVSPADTVTNTLCLHKLSRNGNWAFIQNSGQPDNPCVPLCAVSVPGHSFEFFYAPANRNFDKEPAIFALNTKLLWAFIYPQGYFSWGRKADLFILAFKEISKSLPNIELRENLHSEQDTTVCLFCGLPDLL